MKNKTLHVYLGEENKLKWEAHCEKLGVSPAVAARRLIEQEMRSISGDYYIRQPAKGEGWGTEKKQRFEILLTESERKAIDERAEIDQVSRRFWIVDAIRERLTRQPQLSVPQMRVLGESNYQLLAIGRNLNQVARALNADPAFAEKIKSIKKIKQAIDDHTELVANIFHGTNFRWPVEALKTSNHEKHAPKPKKRS